MLKLNYILLIKKNYDLFYLNFFVYFLLHLLPFNSVNKEQPSKFIQSV